MRLTLHSNYAIRLLMYCALQPDDAVPVVTGATAYRNSEHHLAKIAQTLADLVADADPLRARLGMTDPVS